MGDEDSVLVGELRDATRLSDGRLVLLDGDRRAVLFLSADGAVLATSGRAGAGPGEFQYPAWLGPCVADSVFVWDVANDRVSLFSPDGALAREFRPAVTAPVQPTCLPTGGFAALDARNAARNPAAPGGEVPLIRGALIVMSPTGDSIAARPDLPIGEEKAIGALAGLAVLPDRIVTGLNASAILTSHNFAADTVGRDSVPVTPVPYSAARFEAMAERQAGSVPGGDSTVHRMLREMILRQGMPEHAPLFQVMHGAPDGTVWWVTSLPVDSVTTMLGLREGVPVRSLALPAGIEVFEVGADYLLGKRTDQDGFERLVLYRW
jgi:hypothetical protein